MIKQEEPCEGRLSSTVPWEREGEIPLRAPINKNRIKLLKSIFIWAFPFLKEGEEVLEFILSEVEGLQSFLKKKRIYAEFIQGLSKDSLTQK